MNTNKKLESVPSMFLVGMLLFLSMVMVGVNAVSVAKLCVDIPCWVAWYCHEFVANVNITDVEDLYSFDFKLAWDTTYLDFVGVEITPPAEWGTDYDILKNETIENYNATHGRYWLAVVALPPVPSFNGSTILANLTFNVTVSYVAPPFETWCYLDLYDTELYDSEALLISHEVYDGSYVILFLCPCIPELMVQPSHYEATTFGENFTINVFYNLLNSYFDFGHWKAKLGYNTTLLDVIKVEEGPFIGRFRKSDSRYFTADIHEEEGYIEMAGGILGPCATPYGAGTLAKVTFNVTYVTTPPTIATCVLDLYGTNFTDSKGQQTLSPDVTDGLYQAPCVPPTGVGGIWIPVNKLELLAPYIGLTILLTVAIATLVYVKKRKRE